jgi:hypothetical protein
MAREVNRLKTEDAAAANAMAAHMRKLSSVLGLLNREPDASCRRRERTTGSGGNRVVDPAASGRA